MPSDADAQLTAFFNAMDDIGRRLRRLWWHVVSVSSVNTVRPQISKPNVFTVTLESVDKIPLSLAQSVSDKCLTMWHKDYLFRLPYAHYLLKLWESNIVIKIVEFHVIVTKTQGLKWEKSVCSQCIICLHCYHKRSKCSSFTLRHIVRWWRHC